MSNQSINKEIVNRINQYCDNALNKEEVVELMQKVHNDPKLEAILVQEKAFRDKLKFALGRTPASSILRDTIKEQIDNI